jgi:hypothetical protein
MVFIETLIIPLLVTDYSALDIPKVYLRVYRTPLSKSKIKIKPY